LAEVIQVRRKSSREEAVQQEVLKTLVRAEKENMPSVLITMTASTGSTPRKAGSQVVVFPDGLTVGTIGGGCAEADAKREALNYGYYSVPLTLTKNILGLFLVFYTNLGWKGIILGHLIAQVFFSVYALITFVREEYLKKYINKEYISDLLKFGGPISVHKIGVWLSNALNKILLNTIIGVAATGSYGVAATFGIIVTVIGDAVTKAYVPFLYEKLKTYNEKTAVQLVKLIYGYYGFYLVITILISFLGYFGVGIIFGQQYADTRTFVLPIILAATINALYKIHVDFISFIKKTYMIAATTITCGILNIFVAHWFITAYGILGAAWSAVIIQFLTYIVIFYLSNRQFKLPWGYFIFTKK